MSEQDTREKLEADVHSVIFQWGWDSEWSRNAQRINECVVRNWLDRQAAITKRECSPEAIDNMLNTIGELEEQVNKLTEERDLWNERARQSHDYALELIAERDELQKRNEQLEYANKLASKSEARKIECINQLEAERDNLQAAIDAMNNGQFYSMYKDKCEECEQLTKVVRTQAESFKKLEIELGKQ